jgi:hypothetical protein
MKKITLLLIVFLLLNQLSAQQNLNNGSWLVIVNGFATYEEAIKAKNKYDINTVIINSAHYENLNPGWFIIALLFETEEKARQKSKELNLSGGKSYVKYSGVKKIVDNSIKANVKFVLNNEYIVLCPLNSKLKYEDRNHDKHYYGSTIDLISSVEIDELTGSEKLWYNESICLVDRLGGIIENVKINKLYILSRIQIESYRPPWCWPPPECEHITDKDIMKYVWDNPQGAYIVAKIEKTDAILAIKNIEYKPDIYTSAKLGRYEASHQFKKYSENSVENKAYACKGDTIVTFCYPFIDEECGHEFTNYEMQGWRVGSSMRISVPFNVPEISIDLILKFSKQNKSYFLKQNRNQSVLKDLDDIEDIELSFEFKDPIEC